MNYFEHDKFPNHDTAKPPCIVKVVDNYYYYSVCNADMPQQELIPKELGEYFRDQQGELSLTSLIDALGDISALAVNFDGYEIAEGLKPLVNDMQLIALNALNGEEWVSPDWIKLDDAERIKIP